MEYRYLIRCIKTGVLSTGLERHCMHLYLVDMGMSPVPSYDSSEIQLTTTFSDKNSEIFRWIYTCDRNAELRTWMGLKL